MVLWPTRRLTRPTVPKVAKDRPAIREAIEECDNGYDADRQAEADRLRLAVLEREMAEVRELLRLRVRLHEAPGA